MKKITINHDARSIPVNSLYGRNLLPFMGVQYDVEVNHGKGKKFRIITYQAYNAMGLIGSEHNGIAILDETSKQVLADQIYIQNTGYFGAIKAQFDKVDAIASLDWQSFRHFINNYNRSRYAI